MREDKTHYFWSSEIAVQGCEYLFIEQEMEQFKDKDQ